MGSNSPKPAAAGPGSTPPELTEAPSTDSLEKLGSLSADQLLRRMMSRPAPMAPDGPPPHIDEDGSWPDSPPPD
jgi:hypothetical protein